MAVRRTRIVASIGPASWDGRSCARSRHGRRRHPINLSHGEPSAQLGLIDRVRRVSAEEGRGLGVLVDLPGPSRHGPVPHRGCRADAGRPRRLRGAAAPASGLVVIGVDLDRRPGGGRSVTAAGDGAVMFEVVDGGDGPGHDGDRGRSAWAGRRGGRLQGRPGIHHPRGQRRVRADRRDPRLALAASTAGADAVAASSSSGGRRPAAGRRAGPDRPQVVAKIETAAAVDDAEAILAVADAIMVARGDLHPMPIEDVPHVQKRLVRAGHRRRAAGHHRHADARVDGHRRLSHPGRGVRRGQRRVRRHRRRHAVGRDRGGHRSGRGGGRDGLGGGPGRAASDHPQGAKLGRLRRSVPLPTTAKITDATSEGAWRVGNVAAAAIVLHAVGDTARAVARFQPTVPVVAVSPSDHPGGPVADDGGHRGAGPLWSTTDDMVWLATEVAVAAGMAGVGDVVWSAPTRATPTRPPTSSAVRLR